MGAARLMFDESKHPRGFHGRFGPAGVVRGYSARNVGRKGTPVRDLPHVAAAGKRALRGGASRHSAAGASTLVHSRVPGKRVRIVSYQTAVARTPSGGYISGTGVFVNRGNGWQGKGLHGWGGQIGVKGQSHLGIKPKKAEQVGRHRARDVMGR